MGAIDDYKKAIEEKIANRFDLVMLMFCCYVDTIRDTSGEEQMRYCDEFENDIIEYLEKLKSNT